MSTHSMRTSPIGDERRRAASGAARGGRPLAAPHPRLPRPVAYARSIEASKGQSIGFERADAVQCLVGGHPDRVDQDRGARPLSRCSKKSPGAPRALPLERRLTGIALAEQSSWSVGSRRNRRRRPTRTDS